MRLNHTGVEIGLLRVFALSTMLISLCSVAAAGTVQTVRFAQTGKVLVWMDGVMIGQGAEVYLNAESPSDAPIMGNGSLEPAGSISPDTSHRIVVSVASNTGFVLESETPFETGEISVRVLKQGQNAQALTRIPAYGSQRLFEQTDRTATDRGAPITQSLTLEVVSTGRALKDIKIRATAP